MSKRKTKSKPAAPSSFEIWKAACNAHAADVLPGLGDMWAEDDPYDLTETARDAFDAGQTAEAFVEDAFAEDLDRQKYDNDLAAEAIEHEAEPEE
jgi:hypothetical protein